MRILVVCLGNICRSPAAEAALREAVLAAGLADSVEIDSAGTGDWHIGHPPDPRMIAAASDAGLHLDGRARQIIADDFTSADLILVMDRANLQAVRALASDDAAREKVRLYMSYAGDADAEVPDPYYGGPEGFAHVVALVRSGATAIADVLRDDIVAVRSDG